MTQLSPLGRFEEILLATDGSEFSAGALRVALAIAGKCEVKLTAVTVILSNPEYDALAPQLAEQAELQARAIMTKVQAAAEAAGVEIEPVVRRGLDPAEEIAALAEEIQSDLVVMGRRGRRGLARMMVGDATARVCGQAKCSVLVVPKASQMPQKRILVATDGSRCSDAAAFAAGRLAAMCSLPVTVVSAIQAGQDDAQKEEARQSVERVKQAYREDGLNAEALVAEADRPEDAIIQTVESTGADLIVVGSHGRTGLEKVLLGSVSQRVIGLSRWPVLVVKAF